MTSPSQDQPRPASDPDVVCCPKCGRQHATNARFCGGCGAQLCAGSEPPVSGEQTTLGDPGRRAHSPAEQSSGGPRASAGGTDSASPSGVLAVGSVFAKRYRILEQLGRGGMGRVYRVRDLRIDEEIALKVIHADIACQSRMVERFRNELKLARKIVHANVCRVYHFEEEAQDTPYITMEYVPGEDLAALIRRQARLDSERTVAIARQVCAGLVEAHRHGVVHRDLKPQNIRIDRQGRVRIMDFGIAHHAELSGNTDAGSMVGTPDYVSPEQVSGDPVDARSDIYSLGVVLFEMVTGRRPFEGDTPLVVVVKHKTALAPDPRGLAPEIPAGLSQVILRCLEKDRERRYPSAQGLLADLNSLAGGLAEALSPTIEASAARAEARTTGRPRQAVASVDGARGIRGLPATGPALPRGFASRRRKLLLALATLVLLGGAATAVLLVRQARQSAIQRFGRFIVLDVSAEPGAEEGKKLTELMLLRALGSSSRLTIFLASELARYQKTSDAAAGSLGPPLLTVAARLKPQLTGFEIQVSVEARGRLRSRSVYCKGAADLVSNQVSEILTMVVEQSGGRAGKIDGQRSLAAITSGDLDALRCFIAGEEAWSKLSPDIAYDEYKTAIEIDQRFSLAHLRLADVLAFRGDSAEARQQLELALARRDGLIEYDLLRLRALQARLSSQPREERQVLRTLIEAFPLKKELHYEVAESYFHSADAEEAIKHYGRALELDPDFALAHNHLAYSYSWVGKHALADQHFERYVELDRTANSYDSLAGGLMFAGRFDQAIAALRKGIQLDPNLDYLYRTMAGSYLQQGALTRAAEAIGRQMGMTRIDHVRVGDRFYLAYIEWLRGNPEQAHRMLEAPRAYYAGERLRDSVDGPASEPFWLTGVIAFERGEREGVAAMRSELERRVKAQQVTATNYFPVYKYYLHLSALEAQLRRDTDGMLRQVAEAHRIRHKMGYWDSIFHLPHFFATYAELLLDAGRPGEAEELLVEALAYNPSFAPTHTALARLATLRKDGDKAKQAAARARQLLSGADADYVLLRRLAALPK